MDMQIMLELTHLRMIQCHVTIRASTYMHFMQWRNVLMQCRLSVGYEHVLM